MAATRKGELRLATGCNEEGDIFRCIEVPLKGYILLQPDEGARNLPIVLCYLCELHLRGLNNLQIVNISLIRSGKVRIGIWLQR